MVGDKKSIFENIDGLDLTETRALLLCIPEKFELDKDGKKLEWRQRLFAHAKLLVSQQRHDTVKSSWDEKTQTRLMVQLPPLKPEQTRRSVYFYRTKAQYNARLKQYEDRENVLKRKKNWLAKATLEAQESKKEYDTIINEMRLV